MASEKELVAAMPSGTATDKDIPQQSTEPDVEEDD